LLNSSALQMDKYILPGSYLLEVQTLSGYMPAFYETKFLYVESTKFSIFIQTDKAIYRPGELIKFRIMILDADTKPIMTGSGLKISIFDPTQNMVHQSTTGTDAKYGVYLGEWKTSVDDRTGIWQIEAQFENKVTKNK
jgi:CD109 antigen